MELNQNIACNILLTFYVSTIWSGLRSLLFKIRRQYLKYVHTCNGAHRKAVSKGSPRKVVLVNTIRQYSRTKSNQIAKSKNKIELHCCPQEQFRYWPPLNLFSVLFDLFLLRRASSASVNLAFFLCPRGNLKIIQRNVIFSKANIKFSRLFWLTSVASLVYFPFDWFTNGDNIKFTIHYQSSRKTFSALQWQTCPMDGHLEPTSLDFLQVLTMNKMDLTKPVNK